MTKSSSSSPQALHWHVKISIAHKRQQFLQSLSFERHKTVQTNVQFSCLQKICYGINHIKAISWKPQRRLLSTLVARTVVTCNVYT